jgi:hypothetical protein
MKTARYTIILLIIASNWASACDRVTTVDPVTEIPTLRVTQTETSVTNTVTIPDPTLTVTPGLTPAYIYAPDEGEPVYPLATLRILSPGDGSSLVSPIRPELSILLGADSTIEVELLNSNGELLVKKLLRYPEVDTSERILIQPEMDFEVPGNEQTGRLVVKSQDTFGRLIALASCDLVLLSTGESSPEVAHLPYDSFLLIEPLAGEVIQGGVVQVSGYARPVGSSMIVIELVDENGIVVSTRVLSLSSGAGGAPVEFSTTLPYQVERVTPVRLILRQTRGAIPGPAVASSILISVR